MKKLLQLLVIIGIVSVASNITAMNIDTGREFPIDNLENMPRVFGCIDFIKQATDKLQELQNYIMQKKSEADRSTFASKLDRDKFNKSAEFHIKSSLREVRKLIDKAEKEAAVAI